MNRRLVIFLLVSVVALAGSVPAAAAGPLPDGVPKTSTGYKDGG